MTPRSTNGMAMIARATNRAIAMPMLIAMEITHTRATGPSRRRTRAMDDHPPEGPQAGLPRLPECEGSPIVVLNRRADQAAGAHRAQEEEEQRSDDEDQEDPDDDGRHGPRVVRKEAAHVHGATLVRERHPAGRGTRPKVIHVRSWNAAGYRSAKGPGETGGRAEGLAATQEAEHPEIAVAKDHPARPFDQGSVVHGVHCSAEPLTPSLPSPELRGRDPRGVSFRRGSGAGSRPGAHGWSPR